MVDIGYTIMGEQRGPRELVADAVLAEQAGFDFLVASDHYSPWLEAQGHAPYTWAVLGAVAQATSRIELMTYVTCPTLRYHPAVVAQKAATLGLLSQGRFSLGLGAGENLNEHVVGRGWRPVDVRHEMLTEAVEIIRELFGGGFVNYRGQHFDVESAKLYDLPTTPVRIGIAASGTQSCTLAATLGDFAIGTEPTMPATYRSVGGSAESVGQFPSATANRPPRGPCCASSSVGPRWAGRFRLSCRVPHPSTPPRRTSASRTCPRSGCPGRGVGVRREGPRVHRRRLRAGRPRAGRAGPGGVLLLVRRDACPSPPHRPGVIQQIRPTPCGGYAQGT